MYSLLFELSQFFLCFFLFAVGERFFPARLMWKLSMDMAERNGSLFLRRLAFADRNKERAMSFGFFFVNTPGSSTIARLFFVAAPDHNFFAIHPSMG